jgi:hypothetical protein
LLETQLATKANVDNVYTKSETDGLLATKADTTSVYTQAEVDTALATKANQDDVSQLGVTVSLKADASSV